MATAGQMVSEWFDDEPEQPVLQWLVRGPEIAPAPVVHQLWQERLIERVFGELYVTIGNELTPAMRALCAAKMLPNLAVVSHLSAAWVHCGGPCPKFAEGLLPLNTFDSTTYESTVIRRIAIDTEEIVTIANVQVTTPERTLIDLARWSNEEEATDGISRLIDYGVDIQPILRTLPSHVRFGRRAITRLAQFISRPPQPGCP